MLLLCACVCAQCRCLEVSFQRGLVLGCRYDRVFSGDQWWLISSVGTGNLGGTGGWARGLFSDRQNDGICSGALCSYIMEGLW